MEVLPGDNIPLSVQLWDGDSGLYPQASLFREDGTPHTPATLAMAPAAGGLYVNATLVMPPFPLHVQYAVYDDNLFTNLDEDHTFATDTIVPAQTGGGGGGGGGSTQGTAMAVAMKPDVVNACAVIPPVISAIAIEEDEVFAIAVEQEDVAALAINPAVADAELNE